MTKQYWFNLDEKGHCGHVKDIVTDTKLLGAMKLAHDIGYEILQCKTCGYIYCGRLPLKYFLEKI